MRLNRQDGGRRQCIGVTNNEVASDEAKELGAQGHRPGDAEWERWGICEYITKPRISAAVTGVAQNGEAVQGDYSYTDKFPLAEGLEENVEFFTMTYEASRPVAHNRAFGTIAPVLWLKAGARGRRIEEATADYDVADTYGVLFDLDASGAFLSAVRRAQTVRMAFVVPDDDRGFNRCAVNCPPEWRPFGYMSPTSPTSQSTRGGSSRAVHAEGLPGGRCRGCAGTPCAGEGRLASTAVAGSILVDGDNRRGQDRHGGGRDRGAVPRQPGP